MAITRRFQAQAVVTAAEHSRLVTMSHSLLKQQIEILSHTANADGTVTVVFCGQGLGAWAVPVPPLSTVAFAGGKVGIAPRGSGPSTSSSSSGQ